MTKRNQPLPLAETQPGPPLQVSIQLTFGVTGQAVQCPAFRVGPGMSISLYTINAAGVNAHPCSIALYPEALGTSSARNIPPGADVTVPWPVDNTAEIWASGTAGDGLLVTVSQAAIG